MVATRRTGAIFVQKSVPGIESKRIGFIYVTFPQIPDSNELETVGRGLGRESDESLAPSIYL